MSEESRNVEVPAKFIKLVEEIETMSVLDLSELVHVLEEKFGVSSVMPMMSAQSASGGSDGAEHTAVEKTLFNVELKAVGGQKIQVIKVLREATGLGLAESKALVDAAPKIVKENASREEAEELKSKLETAGATVELK